jgi:phosphoglycerate dehydrogenase-like enzyme/glyoxylase-like metal-dependent hydrolase (beta-lactamase superfamily II)
MCDFAPASLPASRRTRKVSRASDSVMPSLEFGDLTMHRGTRVWLTLLAVAFFWVPAQAGDELPQMKFNEVKEVAPGVFFRYSAISATDKTVAFGGSNNVWIVFDDYVVVIDANFPKEAGDVIAAVKKTTDKPIRYVLDTHHHGDHAYGNDVFSKAGSSIVAQANCFRLLRDVGPAEFRLAGKGPTGRKDVAQGSLKVPNVVFDDKLVLDDGKQRVEFLFLGHAHTAGDAFAYLPKHKLLCTGDACVNGAFNFMGHSDSASWVRVLERAQQLDVKWVLPGHGSIAGKHLLEMQKRYFAELRAQVQAGINADKSVDDIIAGIELPWYKDWTGVTPPGDNVKHVYSELTGRITPWDLLEDFGVYEGSSPSKDSSGWTKPRRIVVPNLMPARLAELKRVAPEIEFIPVKSPEDAAKAVEDADAVIGYCTPEIVKAGRNLRWIQVSRLQDTDLSPELRGSKVVVTDAVRVHGPNMADQAFALLLALSRGLREIDPMEIENGEASTPDNRFRELHGKTMLVVGLGGIGTEISRRAHGFGMRVMAIDPKDKERPSFVYSLQKPESLNDLCLPLADVVVVTCPLTGETRGMIGETQFQLMKKSAYLINVSDGAIIQTAALVAALENKKIAGAGLDVTDPQPLPKDHKLLKMTNVVISPRLGLRSAGAADRQWRLWRENVRRFVAGEKLLCVVDKAAGY